MEEKNDIPVMGFAAFSGTGKTTLLEKLIPLLRERGLRVAVIKHSSHEVEADREGSDTRRFAEAGADVTVLSARNATVVTERRERSLHECLALIRDVDLILVEGYKSEPIPRIGLVRAATGTTLPGRAEEYAAIVTEEPVPALPIPQFRWEDTAALADFLADFPYRNTCPAEFVRT